MRSVHHKQLHHSKHLKLTNKTCAGSEYHWCCLRDLVCKVEEVRSTLTRHLAKEEKQLFPLLQQHFSHTEQAELIAQFLCCIPLDTVEGILMWLKPEIPQVNL